jgi:hypothetical protein
MRKKTYTVYKFEELSKTAQVKVMEELADCNICYEWWDGIYDDAKQIGLEIEGFDLDRGNSISGVLLDEPNIVIANIKKNHGKGCLTYKTALRFQNRFKKVKDEYYDLHAFLNALLNDYLKTLKQEYEYRTSDIAIKETIDANDYEFLENGWLDFLPDMAN